MVKSTIWSACTTSACRCRHLYRLYRRHLCKCTRKTKSSRPMQQVYHIHTTHHLVHVATHLFCSLSVSVFLHSTESERLPLPLSSRKKCINKLQKHSHACIRCAPPNEQINIQILNLVLFLGAVLINYNLYNGKQSEKNLIQSINRNNMLT